MTFKNTTLILSTVALLAAGGLSACSDAANDMKDMAASEVKTAADGAKDMAAKAMPAKGLVNVNTISADMLTKVPGVSERISNTITAGRPFASMRALDDALDAAAVPSIAREGLYKHAFVPMDINTTPEEDFTLIPGVGTKMAHEFEEYRPYSDYAQFEREIGKYVDAKEVARLRQYITIN